jgi:hypothetical protein
LIWALVVAPMIQAGQMTFQAVSGWDLQKAKSFSSCG